MRDFFYYYFRNIMNIPRRPVKLEPVSVTLEEIKIKKPLEVVIKNNTFRKNNNRHENLVKNKKRLHKHPKKHVHEHNEKEEHHRYHVSATAYYSLSAMSIVLAGMVFLYEYCKHLEEENNKEKAISTELSVAVVRGDFEEIKKLINEDGGRKLINKADKHGDTALHYAAKLGNFEILEFLLQHGADPTCSNAQGATPFYEACANGSIKCIQLLEKHGKDLYVTDNEKILELDPYNNYVSFGEMTKTKFDIINYKTLSNVTPLLVAFWNHNELAVKFLLSHGATLIDKEDFQNYDFVVAILRSMATDFKGNDDVTEKFTDIFIKEAKNNPYFLEQKDQIIETFLLETKNLSMTKRLIEGLGYESSDKTHEGRFIFEKISDPEMRDYLISRYGFSDEQLVNHLIEKFKIESLTEKVCLAASIGCLVSTKRFLAEYKFQHHELGLVFDSISRGNSVSLMRIFMEELKKSDVKFTIGHIPLINAISNRNEEMVNYLLEQRNQNNEKIGDFINEKDNKGKTLLFHAVSHNMKPLVKELLDNGADPNIADKDNNSPLHAAAKNGNPEIAQLLLNSKIPICNIDSKNKEFERTPLHEAARQGHKEVVVVLLENGSSPYEETKHGRMAKDLTRDPSLKGLIENFGSPPEMNRSPHSFRFFANGAAMTLTISDEDSEASSRLTCTE